MRLYSAMLIPMGLLAIAVSSVNADDPPARLPSIPTLTTDRVPSYTYPNPMGSSSGSGMIMGDPGAQVIQSPPAVIDSQAPTGGAIVWERNTRSYSSTIDQFQSSSYWTTSPVPFNPAAAPDYGSGLARGWGTHVRYPYFKHRAPWTYQGPAGISHTIHW